MRSVIHFFVLFLSLRAGACDQLNSLVNITEPIALSLSNRQTVGIAFVGFKPRHLQTRGILERLNQEIREIHTFLEDLARGQPDEKCPTCRVHVRPGNLWTYLRGQELVWHGGDRISVYVPFLPCLGVCVPNADRLSRLWNSGASSTPIPRWEYINPSSPVRQELRRALHRIITRIKEGLEILKNDTHTANTPDLRNRVESFVRNQVGNPHVLSERARATLGRLGTMSRKQLLHVIDSLQTELNAPDLIANIDERLTTAITGATPTNDPSSRTPSVSVALSGLVGVANAHDIQVQVSMVNGELQTHTHGVNRPLWTLATGLLVATATSDRVHVDLGVERSGGIAGVLAINRALESVP